MTVRLNTVFVVMVVFVEVLFLPFNSQMPARLFRMLLMQGTYDI